MAQDVTATEAAYTAHVEHSSLWLTATVGAFQCAKRGRSAAR